MATSHLHEILIDALRAILRPLADVEADPGVLSDWLTDAGFSDAAAPLDGAAAAAAEAVDAVEALFVEAQQVTDIVELGRVLADVGKAVEAVRALADAIAALSAGGGLEAEAVATRVLERLVVGALDRFHPAVVPSLVALGLAERWRGTGLTSAPAPNKLVAREFISLAPDRLSALLRDPVQTLAQLYTREGLAHDDDALDAADRLMPALAEVLSALGLRVAYGSADVPLTETADGVTARGALLLSFAAADGAVGMGAAATIASGDSGGPGVAIAPFGEIELSADVGAWTLALDGSATVDALLIGPAGVRSFGGADPSFSASLMLTPRDGVEPWSIGVPDGTRIEIPRPGLRAFLDLTDAGGEISIQGVKLVIKASDGDGFLQAVLPKDPIVLALDLTLGASLRRRFYVEGGAGATYTLRLHETIGPIHLEAVTFELSVAADVAKLTVTADGSLVLGPITATVEGIGVAASVAFGQRGNLGSANLGLAFKPPIGAGLSVDASGITGGGFLEIDTDAGRYAGMLGLNFGEIGIAAIGLIQTKLPDGRDTFSMLVSIGVIFDPAIQLSFGFTLAGVGGLIGIHRDMLTEEVQRGIKNHTLDAILFPDPATVVENAPTILSDLDAVFPTADGRFVVGPMVKIAWGTPSVITADIGIFLSLPDPVRAVMLGQVEAAFPTPDEAVVTIHMDVLGVIDLGKQQLSFQTSIYDSRVLVYTLLGDSAFFLEWGDDPQFALSIGGFHPKFDPPAPPTIFSGLNRLGLELSSGSDLSIACKGYMALTPNSLQFGARIDLHAKGGGATVDGYLGFDALFYFSPFSMEASISGAVSIRYEGHKLADIRLSFDLSGPTPWDARGSAHIDVLCFDVDVGFHFTWGSHTLRNVPSADPLPQVIEAFERPASWSSVLPAGRVAEQLAPRKGDAGELVVHPAGTLEVKQRVAPLGVTLQTFGNAPIKGHDQIMLKSLKAGALEVPFDDALDYFARGQFEKLSNQEKLSVPSFEKMASGAQTARADVIKVGGVVETRELAYESILLGADLIAARQAAAGRTPFAGEGSHLRRGGPAARRTTVGRFTTGAAGKVEVHDATFTLVRKSDLKRLDASLPEMTRMRAEQILAERVVLDPSLSGQVLVVPSYEAEAP